ncbi:hypothetical protein BGW36DRAFT_403542 [Talaromyces proteolyticus]|uniref:Arrestin C-terminal-like domain-containing protein n=1 Tax=Talaromyces proteolyticus TaxID=1131652 RepID=A0AAD4KYN8_9EURO|nr:uncharacterized protein BGW36DRAFT_403542 [Talaromyces proteolyticus]KAH8703064.1 hypothetical protein BGW36DRAFT_403542 [Talaromyces proteolyticus]
MPFAPSSNSDITVCVSLLEPTIYVTTHSSAPSVLRGRVVLSVSKEVRIRHAVIRFQGAIRSRKVGRRRANDQLIVSQTWPMLGVGSRTYSNTLFSDRNCRAKRRGSTCFASSTTESENHRPNCHEILTPGRYVYGFELTPDQMLPESFDIGGYQLKYHLQALVYRPGIFNRDISQSQEVTVLRCPDEMYQHDTEHISLSRTWNKRIPYQVEVSGKGAPIDGDIPIAITVSCRDIQSIIIQVYLGQKITYSDVKGKEPKLRRKLLMKGKCRDLSAAKFSCVGPSCDVSPFINLEQQGETVKIYTNLPLPDESSRFITMHSDVDCEKLRVTHSLLFIIDVTTPPNEYSPHRPTLCRLTAETAFCIRSPHTQVHNMFVPQYSQNDMGTDGNLTDWARISDTSERLSSHDLATIVTQPPSAIAGNNTQQADSIGTACVSPTYFPPIYRDLSLGAFGERQYTSSFPPPPAYESIM